MNLKEFKNVMPNIFEQVKKDVKKILGRHRAGLSLGLAELGMYRGGFIGGMHFPPGTDIVMNKTPLKIILEEQPYQIVWSYTYHIFLHEYVHSLGIWDERMCRATTLRISEEIFKDADHPAIVLAKNGIGTYFPNLNLIYAPPEYRPDGLSKEYVYGFDRESYTYYT
ncbi:MAG: hypothetical protein ACFFDO_08320 [Candidatus Thorarchaeota archaeon]